MERKEPRIRRIARMRCGSKGAPDGDRGDWASRVAEAAGRLGFGLRLGQGFPVCGSISAGHANRCTSALFKPGLQISRTRLAQILSIKGMHSESITSRLQKPQAKALQMGVKRLAFLNFGSCLAF